MSLITIQYQNTQVHIYICLLSFSFLTLLKFSYFDKLSHIKILKEDKNISSLPMDYIYGLKITIFMA